MVLCKNWSHASIISSKFKIQFKIEIKIEIKIQLDNNFQNIDVSTGGEAKKQACKLSSLSLKCLSQ